MFPRMSLSVGVGSCLLWAGLSLASVGRISVLTGEASRTPRTGQSQGLKTGSTLDVGDTLEVKKGNLSFVLNDGSVLMLGEGTKLELLEAAFDGSERKAFSGRLLFGKLWTKVSKAKRGSQAKFSIVTPQAEAGVRGTIFRVDTAKLMNALKPNEARTIVKVMEGKVVVRAKVRPTKGPRHLVSGPTQVSAQTWEKRFTELQAMQQLEVGEELWKAHSYDPTEDNDDFSKFVQRHERGD